MGKKLSLREKGIRFFTYAGMGALILYGCAATVTNQGALEQGAVIESIKVNPTPTQTAIEITNSAPTSCTAFRLLDPPRIILDVRGKIGSDVPEIMEVNSGDLTTIRLEEGKTQNTTTRVIVGTAGPLDYDVESLDHIIKLTLTPEAGATRAPKPEPGVAGFEEDAVVSAVTPSEPRIFFKKRPGPLTQILGVDFTMLPRGKSRVMVTTDKKARFDLNQESPKSLIMTLPGTTIPPLIMRRLDSSYFDGAVDRVKATLSPAKQTVTIAINLREMVPYHVNQKNTEITIDFGRSDVKPPEKKIVPFKLAQAPAGPKTLASTVFPAKPGLPEVTPTAGKTTSGGPMVTLPDSTSGLPPALRKKYTGAPMTMDFVNADVTNILRLIAEVSNLNIVWGPEVKGMVSMRLKDVPWDQALDLILDNNNLSMRRVGNVIWVTTRAQMAQIEAEEKRKQQEYEAQLQRQAEAAMKAKEMEEKLEPLVTEYIHINFTTAGEIKNHLESYLSERGRITSTGNENRPGRNMIIVTDTAQRLAEIKKVIKNFDTPTKQIMIEARIVDAETSFSRDLGVRWGIPGTASGVNAQRRHNTGVSFGVPTDATTYSSGSDSLVGGTFSSNAPASWAPNLGFSVGYLTSSTLGAVTLNAEIALAENEGKAKTLSAPKVIASNGEEATISRGSTFYLEAAENVEPKEVEAQLRLSVLPTVSYNNYVTMEVTVKDEVEQARGKRGKDLNTKLMVKSGETVVIGGIYTENVLNDESGIPALRRIPFFGWLFKAQLETLERTELLIFLTPTVLESAYEGPEAASRL
jgi:type IV pilus assembly protein PilQ